MSDEPIPSVDVREAARRLDPASTPPGAPVPLLVDVREDAEFEELRAPGAALLPISRFLQEMAQLPTDRPLLMICRSGGRSRSATDHLLRNGFTDVANVDGGMMAWQVAGLPTRSGPIDPGEGDLPAGT